MSWKRANVLDRMAQLLRETDNESGYWLDLGTGDGVFTKIMQRDHPHTTPIQMDKLRFRQQTDLAFLGRLEHLPIRSAGIQGMILAQVLHFIPKTEQFPVIKRLSGLLDSGGKLIIIAYVKGNHYSWVPYHVSEGDIRNFADRLVSMEFECLVHDADRQRPKYAAYLRKL